MAQVACDLLVRESHKWIYVCNDKETDRQQVKISEE
jgi:hypothetical protein